MHLAKENTETYTNNIKYIFGWLYMNKYVTIMLSLLIIINNNGPCVLAPNNKVSNTIDYKEPHQCKHWFGKRKKDYDQFYQKTKSKKLPPQLAEALAKDKNGLFNIWLKVGKDPQRCVVEYEHMKSNRTTDRDLWGYLKKRDMKGLYPEDKIEVLVEKRTSQTWFVDDEDFTTFAYLCCILLLCFALLCFALHPGACILVHVSS